jgi:hypothetical protein
VIAVDRLPGWTAALMECPGTEGPAEALKSAGLAASDLDFRYAVKDPRNKLLDPVTSYFDGTSSMRELVSAQLIHILWDRKQVPELDPERFLRTLRQKYSSETPVNLADRAIHETLDRWSEWMPLPYDPTETTKTQKREAFRASFKHKYLTACGMLTGQ